MSEVMYVKEQINWEDPCTFSEVDCGKEDDLDPEEILQAIIQIATTIRKMTVVLKEIWRETFKDIKELVPDEFPNKVYEFLKNEISGNTVFKDSYFSLQVFGHAIEVIIDDIEYINSEKEKKYYDQTLKVRQNLHQLCCTLQSYLICKEKNTSKIHIPTDFKNPGSIAGREIRDVVFLRQLEENIKNILDKFYIYKENIHSL